MYSCSQVARWIASDEHLTAPLLRKLGIRMHLALCRYCSKYFQNLRALAVTIRNSIAEIPGSEIEESKVRILKQLSR